MANAATTTQARPGPPRSPATTVIRTDIQGLRAIAVTMVLLYHLWPNRLTGGFAGVDVFFVISGFLITSHLLASPPRRGRDLLQFWSRRIRRLLPAALLVLAATLAASRLVAPDTQWGSTANHVKAAALYFVNWRLAADSVDYLARENAPSPVEHFWSLSVEEQFYFIWPILILLLVGAALLLRWRLVPTVSLGLGAVVAASLGYSISETASNPPAAYFVTPTRIWELGIGGLLAAALSSRALGRRRDSEALPIPAPARIALAWAGLAAIGVTAFRYTAATPFPGWEALLPVLGAAAVIAACPPKATASPGPAMALRPVQWLGDVSYSVYLWHWPIIALLPYALDHSLSTRDKLAIVVVSLVLAGLTKRYVEDRFRTPRWGRPLVKPYALAACAMALVVGATALQNHEVTQREAQSVAALHHALSAKEPCIGAAAMAVPAGQCSGTDNTLVLSPLQAAKDRSKAYASVSGGKDCFSYTPSFRVVTCTFGDPQGKVKVALVGNSHAGEWVPALDLVAKEQHWQVTTYLASQCASSNILQRFDTPAYAQACLDWSKKVTRTVAAAHYDLVVMTNRVSVSAVGYSMAASYAQYEKGYVDVLRAFAAAHEPVLGIRDTPAPGTSIPDCLAAHPDDYSACNGTPTKWLPPEPLTTAIASLHDSRIREVDLTRYICRDDVCPAVIGRIPVYFDGSHLTATFNQTLAPYLAPALVRALHS